MNSLDKPMRALDAQPVQGSFGVSAAEAVNVLKPPAERPLVSPDRPVGPDELGRAEDARFLAEVALHRRLDTPFCIALFGRAGSGKTFLLNQIVQALDRLGEAARAAGGESVLMGDAVAVHVDAAQPGQPGSLLAAAVLDRLAVTHAALAADLVHAGADPAEAARLANEALDDLRRRHQAENQVLDDLGSREARLVETVLDAPGSSLDAYARGHRSAIESALRQFGFGGADGLGTYKSLVREAAESPGLPARLGLSLRALWAYRGQTRLLLIAVVAALLAWGIEDLAADQDSWIAALRGTTDKAGSVADWAAAHAHWLGPLHTAAVVVCLLALANVALRATRFLRPIFKGAGLLARDLDGRSRDLKGLLAHQTRLGDGLAAEVEAAARHAGEAERRAGPRPTETAPRQRAGGRARATSEEDQAKAVLDRLAQLMSDGASGGHHAPGRLILAIDNVDARTGAEAAALLQGVRQLLGPGFVSIVAASRAHLAEGFGELDPARAFAQFERCIQVGYRLDAGAPAQASWPDFATRLIDAREPLRPTMPPGAPDATHSALDRPWRPREAETMAALAGFAGDTPRAVKRYVNLYRIARADPHLREAPAPVFTALALALALDAHGLPDDLDALAKASHGEAPGDSTLLRRALAVAREASGEPVELGQAQRGIEVAGRYAARG